MNLRSIFVALILVTSICCAAGFNPSDVEESALHGFEKILDLWRAEDYEGLFAHLTHPPEDDWNYFAGRIVYASRIPACCWEQLQNIKLHAAGKDKVVINARLGLEEEGVGTRFVTRDFVLTLVDGVWRMPMRDVLDLSKYNLQRIPRKIYEIEP
jgi:hypothetical protein